MAIRNVMTNSTTKISCDYPSNTIPSVIHNHVQISITYYSRFTDPVVQVASGTTQVNRKSGDNPHTS